MGQARDEAGNIWETDAQGNAVRLIRPAGQQQSGNVVSLPPSQQQQRQMDREDRRDNRAADNDARRNQTDEAKLILERARVNADLYKSGLRLGENGQPEPIPNWQPPLDAANAPRLTAKERADAIRGYTDAEALERVADALEAQYKAGPGATKGVYGVQDYFPSEANKTFDDTSFQARGRVKRAMGFTGGEGNTIGEINLNYGPYLPEASDRDGQIESKIQALRDLARDSRETSIAVLGGVPDANGRVTPMQRDPLGQPTVTLDAMPAAGAGAKNERVPIPGPMQDEYNAYLSKNLGAFDPDRYAQFRASLDQKYGFPADPTKFEIYREEARQLNETAGGGGRINARIPGPEREMGLIDQGRNNLVNNPVGAAATGVLNMGGFGGVEALAPEAYQALREDQFLPLALGEVGGAITGTGAISKLGKETLGRVAPSLLGGAGKAQFGRNLATDVAYSGIYGGVSQGDPLNAAAMGGAGSIAGQGVGKALGSAVGGVATSPAVQALKTRQIPLTTGQTLGGMFKSLEDAATSIPFVGDMVNARRLDGLRGFNQAAFNEAGQPIGAKVAETGEQGVQALIDQTGNAYDSATAGVNVPIDPLFGQDMALARQAGSQLPSDLAGKFSQAINNRVEPIATAGQMTGDSYQQATRGLKGYRAEMTKPGFEQDYRDALSLAMKALRGNMERGGGSGVVKGLADADQAYRGAKTLGQAVKSARNGSRSGEIQTFTPSQLNDASTQAATKYGGGRQFSELIDAGQSTLPSQVPDSGTARRLMQNLAGAGLIGGGATGYGMTTGDTDTLKKGAAVAGLAALGGTRSGQKLINAALTGRPKALKTLGAAIRKQQGLFGAAAIPLALEAGK